MGENSDSMKTANKWGGVFFDKPSLALIEALDDLFMKLEVAC